MTRHEALEPGAARVEQPAGDTDVAHEHAQHQPVGIGAWPIDRPFPALLTPQQLGAVFGISRATYYELQKIGRWRRFEVQPQILGTTGRPILRYSGALVREYVLGQASAARTFGAKRSRVA